MRVPFFISIPACILVGLLVFWLGSRDKDFMTPPTPERLTAISEEWETSQPNIPPPKPVDANLLADPTSATPKQVDEAPSLEPVKTLPPGDFSQAPSLAEYGAYGDKGADELIKLATFLETEAQYQRALLAWERVLDTCTPNSEQRELTVRSIQRLRKALPPWNPDPLADIQVTLHAGATLKNQKVLTSAMESVAGLITEASNHVLKVDTKISFGKASSIKTPRVPVAVWFSRPTGRANDSTPETSPISFMIDPEQPQALNYQIAAAVYALLKTNLAEETSFAPLPEYPAEVQPNELLKYHVTRLMWREFVKSIKE